MCWKNYKFGCICVAKSINEPLCSSQLKMTNHLVNLRQQENRNLEQHVQSPYGLLMCVCVWVLVVFSTLTYSCSSRFLMIDYINDFGYDLNPPRYKWLWNERWFVTRKGSIEPQRCIDFFTKWIYLELRNPLLAFLGSKNKRKHSNSAWVTTDTLLSIHLQRKTSVFRKALCKRWRSMFAKTEDYFGTLEEEFLFCSFCEGMCLETRSLCSKNRF